MRHLQKPIKRFMRLVKDLGGRCSAVTVWHPTRRPTPSVTICHVFLDDPGEAYCEATANHLARQLVNADDTPPAGPTPSAIILINHANRYATIDATPLLEPVPARPTDTALLAEYEEQRALWIEAYVVRQAFDTAFQRKYTCLIL